MRNRSAAFHSQQHQARIGEQAQRLQAVDFFNVLTGPGLLERTEAQLPEHRERQYPRTVTLEMFLKQALEFVERVRFVESGNVRTRLQPTVVTLRNCAYGVHSTA